MVGEWREIERENLILLKCPRLNIIIILLRLKIMIKRMMVVGIIKIISWHSEKEPVTIKKNNSNDK